MAATLVRNDRYLPTTPPPQPEIRRGLAPLGYVVLWRTRPTPSVVLRLSCARGCSTHELPVVKEEEEDDEAVKQAL